MFWKPLISNFICCLECLTFKKNIFSSGILYCNHGRGETKFSMVTLWLHEKHKGSESESRNSKYHFASQSPSKTSLFGMVGKIPLLFKMFSLCMCVLHLSESHLSLSCLCLWLSLQLSPTFTEVNDRNWSDLPLLRNRPSNKECIFQKFYVALAN